MTPTLSTTIRTQKGTPPNGIRSESPDEWSGVYYMKHGQCSASSTRLSRRLIEQISYIELKPPHPSPCPARTSTPPQRGLTPAGGTRPASRPGSNACGRDAACEPTRVWRLQAGCGLRADHPRALALASG